MEEEARPKKVFKVTVMIVDHDEIGEQAVRDVLEHTTYPNRCLSPKVTAIEVREIMWTDAHPLNFNSSEEKAYHDLFEGE